MGRGCDFFFLSRYFILSTRGDPLSGGVVERVSICKSIINKGFLAVSRYRIITANPLSLAFSDRGHVGYFCSLKSLPFAQIPIYWSPDFCHIGVISLKSLPYVDMVARQTAGKRNRI